MAEWELDGQPEHRQFFDVRLPARSQSVSVARLALDTLDLPGSLRGDARLLLTELVTNSVRHSGLGPEEAIRVRAEWSGRHLRVTVQDRPRDPSTTLVGAIRPSPTSEGGWGLYLVDKVAQRWGVDGQGAYWFELVLADQG
ncbi:MAG: hypothetical protein NVSMB32_03960 [Actinomycetota bacterium]